jgi:hypothetical protein
MDNRIDDVSESEPFLHFFEAMAYNALGGAANAVPTPAAMEPIDEIRLPAAPARGSQGPSFTSNRQYEQLI